MSRGHLISGDGADAFVNYWLLAGIGVVIIGFALRLNPLIVVAAAAATTGIAAGMAPLAIISAFGKSFNDSRFVTIIYILLPVVGLLERYGLQQRARTLISGIKGATVGRFLIVYMGFRQITAALGLISIAGPAQTVRPLVAPMAEAAAERDHGDIDHATRQKVKAFAAASDNIGLFFGEDLFVAIGSILLIIGFLKQNGIDLTPFELSVWAIPSALAAFAVHSVRLLLLDRSLAKGRHRA